MMVQTIMMTLIVISIFSMASGHLSCYICTDCPNIDDMESQPCDFVPPDTTTTLSTTTDTTTVSTTTDTTTESTTTDTTTESTTTDTTTESTTTLAPTHTTTSTPHTPPTATTTSIIPPTISHSFPQIDNLISESIIELTTDKPTDLSDENSDKTTGRSAQISLGPPYRKLRHQTSSGHQCFRIGRTVGDRTEVVRGCVVPASNIHQTCVRANDGTTPSSCRICNYNECNAATRNVSASVVLLFTSIVSIQFMR